jgi:hypothetical protein
MIQLFKRNDNYSKLIAFLLIIISSTAIGQEIIFVPDVDTLSMWGTCVPPGFYWNLSHIDSVTDRIDIHSPDVLMLGDPLSIIERYDSAYFEVRDTIRPVQYKLRYTNYSQWWYPIDCFLPIDSLAYAESGPFDLTLYVQHDRLLADSAVMNFWGYHTGLYVEHDTPRLGPDPQLMQNYPNPFNPNTTIMYQLPATSYVKLILYTTLGKNIITLKDGIETIGRHSVNVNAADLASGVYYYRLETVSALDPSKYYIQVKKMIVLK